MTRDDRYYFISMPMSFSGTEVPQKRRIVSAFGRKAAIYDRLAEIQSYLITLLAGRLAPLCMTGGRWIDLGCGTGLFAAAAGIKGFSGRIIGVDIAPGPLAVYKARRPGNPLLVQADLDSLPFISESFDVAVTASTLQWIENVPQALRNIYAILKKDGILAFSVFIRGSFLELFSIQQRYGIPAPVRCFDPGLFAASLEQAGFRDLQYEQAEKTTYAASAAAVLKNLSAIGGTATAAPLLLNRTKLAEFCSAYEARFGGIRGVPFTCRAMVGQCRKGVRP